MQKVNKDIPLKKKKNVVCVPRGDEKITEILIPLNIVIHLFQRQV